MVGKIFLKHLHNMSGQMLYSDIYITKFSRFRVMFVHFRYSINISNMFPNYIIYNHIYLTFDYI